jgi:CheY-like chemotaxis protein
MATSQRPEPIEILLVDDNPGDVRLTLESLKSARVHNRMHVVEDGERALAFLRRQEPYTDAPSPSLILLDLDLPLLSGREVLEAIKRDPDLAKIPVVVLTTSQADEDVARSYELHASCYVTKPVDFERFLHVIRMISDFWLEVVRLQ